MKTRILPVLLLASLLAACGDDKPAGKQTSPETPVSNSGQNSLPANAPAVGTEIPDTATTGSRDSKQDGEYKEIAWEDLEIPGKGMDDIVKKYQAQIDNIPEGDPKEKAVMEKMQADMNAAPVNPKMNGKKIKLPGFITPLEIDEKNDVIKEFLLVPYFGACIHVPPPPLNQTILVKPQPGTTVSMGDLYSPIWVYGTLSTDFSHTDLADAGYQIKADKTAIYQEKFPDSDETGQQ